jgi:hypothetical protein
LDLITPRNDFYAELRGESNGVSHMKFRGRVRGVAIASDGGDETIRKVVEMEEIRQGIEERTVSLFFDFIVLPQPHLFFLQVLMTSLDVLPVQRW